MACKIDRPDPQVLFDRYLTMFSNTVLGGAAVIPESNEWYASAVNYAVAEEFYAITEQAWKEQDPRVACCDNLVKIAAQNGVFPLPAAYAQGYVKLTGTPGAALPAPLEFTIGDLTYVTTVASQQPTSIGADGNAYVRVRSLTPGEAGNQSLTNGVLNQNLPGVNRPVEVCGSSFCNGAAAETCENLRARYLRRISYQPRATNVWISDKLLEWPCATRVMPRAGSCCVCDDCSNGGSDCENCNCKDCGGKLEFYVMFDGSFPCGIAPKEIVADITAWMFGSPQGYGLGQVEVGVCGRVAAVTGIPVNVYLDIADCATTSQIQVVRDLITEYFTVIAPSTPLRSRTIESILVDVLGAATNYSVRFELVNPLDAEFVFVTACDMEPDCDYLMCLENILISGPDTTPGNC